MKKLTMFILKDCPYCKQAFAIHQRLYMQNPDFRKIDIEIIEENQQKDIAEQYAYYYVPCYFLGKRKLFEGIPTMEAIRKVMEQALR